MDATVEQRDGLRFMYVLPLAPDRLLVEDTAFADSPYLDVAAGRGATAAYARSRGWASDRVVRERDRRSPLLQLAPPVPVELPLVAGYAGHWFHPATGYSFRSPLGSRRRSPRGPRARCSALPVDVRVRARHAARVRDPAQPDAVRVVLTAERYHVLERFYRLPGP
jgi:lycopene beta-cyclase